MRAVVRRRSGFSCLTVCLALLGTFLVAAPAQAAGPRIDLRVLLVTGGQISVEAVREMLEDAAVPVTIVDLRDARRPTIDDAFLADTVNGVPRAKFQSVVLPDENPFDAGSDEMASLVRFEKAFGIRQLDAYVQPKPQVGLALADVSEGGFSGAYDGRSARLTPEALAAEFAYARGPVPFGDTDPKAPESWVEIARPLAGFRTLVSAQPPVGGAPGALVGVFSHDGREELVLTYEYHRDQPQFELLAPGLIRWLTKGVHLGYERSYFAVHFDDVMLPNARWVLGPHCTWGVDCPTSVSPQSTIRMTPDDVAYAVDWQRRNNFRIDLAFNGKGSLLARSGAASADALTSALVSNKDAFGWISHTWSHLYLGCVQDYSVTPWQCAKIPLLGRVRYVGLKQVESEIRLNIDFAKRYGLPIDPSEVVTGEHSGLRARPQMPNDNPNLAPALTGTGIRTIAADASEESDQRIIGSGRTLPRHPINLDYDTATVPEIIDQYNWLFTTKAEGGSGLCEKDASCEAPYDPKTGFTNRIVPAEADLALTHVLGNDPRPHYVHQANLAEGRAIYPILERVLTTYRNSLVRENRPLLVPTMTQGADLLAARSAFLKAASDGKAIGWVQDGVVSVQAPDSLRVPITVPEGTHVESTSGPLFGESYSAERSAWVTVPGAQRYVTPGRR